MRYPAYKSYRTTGLDWLGDVPSHWGIKRLRYCATLNPPVHGLSRLSAQDEVSFVPMEAVGEYGGMALALSKAVEEIGSGYSLFQDGDVVVAKITPCFENGKGALARGLRNGVACGTTELHVLRASANLDRRFLFYLTISSVFRSMGEAEMYGAGGQKRVPGGFVRNFPVPLPPLDEQRAISASLDTQTEKIDTLVAKKQSLIQRLQEKRQALISHVVTRGLPPDAAGAAGLEPSPPLRKVELGGLDRIPDHWALYRIAMVATKITNGYVGPTRDILVDDGVRYLQSLHIKHNRIVFDKPYFVEPTWSAQHPKSILREGDVLIVQTGDIGQVAVVPKEFEGCNCHALIIISPDGRSLTGEYLSLFLNSSFGYHALKRIQTGALHPHLNCGLVRDILIPIPPLQEQKALVAYLAHALGKIDEMMALVEAATDRLRSYRAALITAAITGKIDVRNIGVEAELTEAVA